MVWNVADFVAEVVFQELQPMVEHICVNSSLFAFGGLFGQDAYHLTLPTRLQGHNISLQELVYVEMSMWLRGFMVISYKINVLYYIVITCHLSMSYVIIKFTVPTWALWPEISGISRFALDLYLVVRHVAGTISDMPESLSR